MAAIDLMSSIPSTLYLQICTVSLEPLHVMMNELDISIKMYVILNSIHKYVIHVHCRSVHGYWMKGKMLTCTDEGVAL